MIQVVLFSMWGILKLQTAPLNASFLWSEMSRRALFLYGFFFFHFFPTYIIPFSDNANYFAELRDATIRQIFFFKCCHLYVHIGSCTSAAFSLGWVGGVWGTFSYLAPFLTLLNSARKSVEGRHCLSHSSGSCHCHTKLTSSMGGDDSGTVVTCPFCGGGSPVSDSKCWGQEKQIKGRGRKKPACNSGRLCFVLT